MADATALLGRIVELRPGEARTLLLAFVYHFCLLGSYYILQPLRDGLIGGDEALPWLFAASLGVSALANAAFGALVARMPRRRFLPLVYRFATTNLLAFYLALALLPGESRPLVARAFFLWVGVFNLFAVSVFWAFMADLYDSERAVRLFGFLGAGGTLGQLVGSLATDFLATRIAPSGLLIISAVLLEGGVACIHRLLPELRPDADEGSAGAPSRGGALAGVRLTLSSGYLAGIAGYIFLYTFTSTFLYFAKVGIVTAALADTGARTALYARLNLAVSLGTVLVQLGATGRVIAALGVPLTLGLVPALTAVGLGWLAASPGLWTFAIVDTLRKTANYALARPAREALYTVVGRNEKYSSKNFIDTFVYRLGDGVAAAAQAKMAALAWGMTVSLAAGIPAALLWLGLGILLGREQVRRGGRTDA